MKTLREFLKEEVTQEELATKNIELDHNSARWSDIGPVSAHARNFGYGNAVGVFANKKASLSSRLLFELIPSDVKWLKEIGQYNTKTNEVILRMATTSHVSGNMMGIVKINLVKGVVYFFDEDKEAFESRPEKVNHARFLFDFYGKRVKYV